MSDYTNLAKALRCCIDDNIPCPDCPRFNKCMADRNMSSLFSDAADAIEERQKTVEYYKGCADYWYKEACDYKAMLPRWISVKEALPNVDETKDKYENVVVIASSRGWKKSRPLIYERACVRRKTVYRWKYISGRIYDGIPVTHWMPLPEAQKEET